MKLIQPGDSDEFPTATFEYQPADPVRGRAFTYDPAGNLALQVVALGAMNRVTTRQREKAGEEGEFITAKFTDGCGKALASIEGIGRPGKWVVKAATSYNLRQKPKGNWQPYLVDSLGIPQSQRFGPPVGPPPADAFQPRDPGVRDFDGPAGPGDPDDRGSRIVGWPAPIQPRPVPAI